MEEESPVRRVRVVFEDHRSILDKPQRSEGLKRCWVLLRPELATVSDLASYVFRSFALKRSCPHGIVLSMDGFVLPPFESTCILKDQDIIRVRKKVRKEKKVMEKGSGVLVVMQSQEIERLNSEDDADACNLFENGTSIRAPSTDGTNSKRKGADSDKFHNSKKKKKSKLTSHDKLVVFTEDVADHLLQKQRSPEGKSSKDTKHRKEKPCNENVKSEAHIVPLADSSARDAIGSLPNVESQNKAEESSKRCTPDACADEGLKKLPGRSARHKKEKRQLLKKWRESNHPMNKETHIQSFVPACDIHRTSSKHLQINENADAVEDFAPVLIHPGRICFEAPGQSKEQEHTLEASQNKEERHTLAVSQNREQQHMLAVSQSKEQQHTLPETLLSSGGRQKKGKQVWGLETSRNEGSIFEQQCARMHIPNGSLPTNDLDFTRLFHLIRVPKEGDVIAYRMVLLLASCCPELSPFRVGKVASYDSMSMKIYLVPVPEYPFEFGEKQVEGSALQLNYAPYKEDGALEIEYPSLIDVRLVKTIDKETSDTNSLVRTSSSANKWEATLASSSTKETITNSGGWEQFMPSSNEKAKSYGKDGWGEWPKTENRAIALWFDYCRSVRESMEYFPKRDINNWRNFPHKGSFTKTRYSWCSKRKKWWTSSNMKLKKW